MFVIYALLAEGVPFYVGATEQERLSARLKQHVYDAKNKRKNRQKDALILRMILAGKRPTIVPIERTDDFHDAQSAERFYIKLVGAVWPLTNVKAGGFDYRAKE